MKEYIKTVYRSKATETEISHHQNQYRSHKEGFKNSVLNDLNAQLDEYQFAIKTGSKANLETDLTIVEDDIPLENRGKGRQCFVKTDFALQREQDRQKLDILLLEEPENHLSHTHMRRLIDKISSSENKQLFISTHSNMVCSRLDLRKAIFMNSNGTGSLSLSGLSEDTAKFFMKAPDNNVLELILSQKAVLVEGDAEYILLNAFHKIQTGEELGATNIHVISVGGTSFKRYMELAKLLNIKIAIITDNDSDVSKCTARYVDFVADNVRIFVDPDNSRETFEVAVYRDNQEICDGLFGEGRRTLSVPDYMLQNKADVAFELLDKKGDELTVPQYIQEAITWIRA